MHKRVLDFVESIKEKYPKYFENVRVLDMGSLNINGTPRHLFEGCEYMGIDRLPGNGVDIVSLVHEFEDTKGFDVVITNGTLEHDKYCDLTVKRGWELLKAGGIFIGSAAGVRCNRHNIECGIDNYYQNISREKVEQWAKDYNIPFEITEAGGYRDIFFVAFKNRKSKK